MKIDLGQHSTSEGHFVEAWIEPNRPALRAGAIRDHGFLCVQSVDVPPGQMPGIDLRLESMSEEAWRLSDAVGAELARTLWDQRLKYDREPFYFVCDHSQYGRLYFSPNVAEASEPGVFFQTRPDQRYARDGTTVPEHSVAAQLQAIFVHEQLQMKAPSIPHSQEIAQAIEQSQAMAAHVLDMRAQFAAEVDWDFDKRLTTVMMAATGRVPLNDPDDIENYQSLAGYATRPTDQFVDDNANFYRWHEYGGKARLEPLTKEKLEDYLVKERGYSVEAACDASRCAIAAQDWEWFKDIHLGKMREPIEALQRAIEQEERQIAPDRQWISDATSAADFCRSVRPMKVFGALQEFVAHAERPFAVANAMNDRQSAITEGAALEANPVYLNAVRAVEYMKDPVNGLAINAGHPVTKVLDVYRELVHNNHARWDAAVKGDKILFVEHESHAEVLKNSYHKFEAEIVPLAYKQEPSFVDDEDFQP